jgi:hypothetical protein
LGDSFTKHPVTLLAYQGCPPPACTIFTIAKLEKTAKMTEKKLCKKFERFHFYSFSSLWKKTPSFLFVLKRGKCLRGIDTEWPKIMETKDQIFF